MKTLQYVALFLGTVTLAFFSFSFYIYDSTIGDTPPGPALQLSRIDFESEVDSLTSGAIRSKVKHMKGVTHTYFNQAADILVFSHDPQTIKADAVVQAVKTDFQIPVKRFTVSEAMAASGCPITGNNTVFMRVGGFLYRLF